MENKTVYLDESSNNNYIEALEQTFNKKRNGDSIEVKEGKNYIRISNFPYFGDFEMMVISINLKDEWSIERIATELPAKYHFSLIAEGNVKQSFNNKMHVAEAGSSKGIFVHNGQFKLKSYFPKDIEYKAVVFKISKQTISEHIPEALDIMESMFENDEPKGFHTPTPNAIQRIIDDLYKYKDEALIPKLMVSSKGLELFSLLINSLKKLLEAHELNGLHIDDYNRVLRIKDELINKVEHKINIEDLAKQFAISSSKLHRDFKALYDCSIYSFFTQAKMDEAHRRLQSGNFSVTEVGYDLGYNSISKFSRMFKKLKGISPRDVIPV